MTSPTSSGSAEIVIPLHTENVAVEIRKVERGGIRVHVRTTSRDHLVSENLIHERVDIERVAIGRPVEAVPPIREEGDTTVIPVVEEVVVIERRLILKEEIRLRRVRTTEPYHETVSLREQEAVIERTMPTGREGDPLSPPAALPQSPSKGQSE